MARRFSQTGIQDFLTLTLTEQTGLLYVGAREALFAFSMEALELQGVVRGGGAGGTHVGDRQCRGTAPHPTSSPVGMLLVCNARLLRRVKATFPVRSTYWGLLGSVSSSEINSQSVGSVEYCLVSHAAATGHAVHILRVYL